MSLTKVTYSMIAGASTNVLDFGADPTGVAECSANIQAAINHAATQGVAGFKTGPSQGGVVYFPPGVYRISTTLQMPADPAAAAQFVSLSGSGKTSILSWDGANNGVMVDFDDGNDECATFIEKLAFQLYGSATGVTAIRTSYSGNNSVNLCIRENYFKGLGYALDCYTETDQVEFIKNYVLLFTLGGVRMQGVCSNFQFRDNHFRMGLGWCIEHLGNGANILISGNTMQAALNTFRGVRLKNMGNFRIMSNYWENNVAYSFTDGPFVQLEGVHTGTIQDNNTTGSIGLYCYTVDADCLSITFGPNYHGVSGGTPSEIIRIAAGADQIYVLGQQYLSSGQTANIVTGPRILDLGYSHPQNGAYMRAEQAQSAVRAAANIATLSTATIAQTTDYNGSMFIGVKQTTESYIYIGIVFDGVLTEIAKTNVNLEVQLSGTNVNIYNGEGNIRTCEYWINFL
jgi:hypothetical protein